MSTCAPDRGGLLIITVECLQASNPVFLCTPCTSSSEKRPTRAEFELMRTRRAPASKPATSSDKGVDAIECELLVSGHSCSILHAVSLLAVGGVGTENSYSREPDIVPSQECMNLVLRIMRCSPSRIGAPCPVMMLDLSKSQDLVVKCAQNALHFEMSHKMG